jgi:osmotically-inducible protein OsmY
MKSNRDLQKDVQDSFRWEPLLKGAKIDVTAQDGLVILSGTVKSYLEKSLVESVTKSIFGVNASIEHLTVNLDNRDEIRVMRILLNV